MLLEAALGEIEAELSRAVDPRGMDAAERIRRSLEQALRDISQYARPQMALAGAWLGLRG